MLRASCSICTYFFSGIVNVCETKAIGFSMPSENMQERTVHTPLSKPCKIPRQQVSIIIPNLLGINSDTEMLCVLTKIVQQGWGKATENRAKVGRIQIISIYVICFASVLMIIVKKENPQEGFEYENYIIICV